MRPSLLSAFSMGDGQCRGGGSANIDSLSTPLASDLESGQEPQWQSWAKAAVWRVRDQAAQAAELTQARLSQAAERAQTVDWNEQVQGVRGSLSQSFESVSSTASAATSSLQERVHQGVEHARSVDFSEQAGHLKRGVSRGLENVTSTASSATSSLQEGAATVASSSLHVASDRVTGAATLAMDPAKLIRFGGVFALGTLFIVISFNFLPGLLLKPANFALFFTLGSVTMLSSFVFLNGAESFLRGLMQRDKLPFSSAYVIGLVGTLVATIGMKSYIFTAIFALVQALALLYLVLSYLPGGLSFLNMIGRLGGRSARSVVLG